MHGQGRYTYAVSGDVYEGGWHDGLFHGEGKYTSADGAVYEMIGAIIDGNGSTTEPIQLGDDDRSLQNV